MRIASQNANKPHWDDPTSLPEPLAGTQTGQNQVTHICFTFCQGIGHNNWHNSLAFICIHHMNIEVLLKIFCSPVKNWYASPSMVDTVTACTSTSFLLTGPQCCPWQPWIQSPLYLLLLCLGEALCVQFSLKRYKRKAYEELLEEFCFPIKGTNVATSIPTPPHLPNLNITTRSNTVAAFLQLWGNGQQRNVKRIAVMIGLDIYEPLNQYYQTSLHKKNNNKTLFSLSHWKSEYLFLVAEQIQIRHW